MDTTYKVGCLVIYKKKPGLVRQVGEKLQVELAGGELISVRPKDLVFLHPGPLQGLRQVQLVEGDIETAWEILRGGGSPASLAELAELAYGEFSPSTAWSAWQQVQDGLFFSGDLAQIYPRSPAEVRQEKDARQARSVEALAWAQFLECVRSGEPFLPEHQRYLKEVQDLALGLRADSRALRELGHAERPEVAHGLLLEWKLWNETIDPYPSRLGLPAQPPDLPAPALPPEERRDLTHLPAFAIDDQGSQDPDDAISLDGRRLWVHIADAAAQVSPGSPLDLEARARGSNNYLPEGTVPMLPWSVLQRLGLGLNEISPALSIGLELDAESQVTQVEILPSWVRVQRLSYDQAETLLETEPLFSLEALARSYRERRLANGAVEIDLPEVIIRLIDGHISIQPVLPLRSRMLVKDAMLMAGEAAALFASSRELPFPYTIQPPADPAHLAELLSRLGERRLVEGRDLAAMFALRRAQNRSQASSLPGRHAGLGLPIYARVTSPLRRYPDLVAHQQLRLHLSGGPVLDAQEIIERVSQAELAGADAARAEALARRHWTLVHLLRQPGWQGQAVLVEKHGLRGKIILPELALEAPFNLRTDLPLNSQLTLSLRGVDLPGLEVFFQEQPVHQPG